jgi:non-ribosomal peptide synthetase component E (peptide arylation enzyme)
VIIWPFAAKDGPMGKQPAMLAPLQARVSAVACNPKQEVLACGYANGIVLMVRIDDGAEILVRRDGSPVAGLAWTANGATLAYVCEDGEAGLLTF